jgi:hypothetical protein
VVSDDQSAPAPRHRHGHNNGHNPLRSAVIDVSRTATLVGKVIYRRHRFNPDELCEGVKAKFLADLRDGASKARQIADEADKAIEYLTGAC